MDAYITGTPQKPKPLTLAEVISREGQRIKVGANKPIRLDDPQMVWVVASGHADLFYVEYAPADFPACLKIRLLQRCETLAAVAPLSRWN